MSAVETDLARVLDRVREWLQRFIIVPDEGDLDTLALWCAHTWALDTTATTPRLLIDSSMPGSGKTTCLEHLNALCMRPLQAASIGSPAVLTRALAAGPRTVLIDEVDRTLDPKREGVGELIAVINAGYKNGSTRPVSVKTDGDWTVKELPTYAPIAMAGNAPLLPDDTRQRCIRVLLMPDLRGVAEDTDWEEIDPWAVELRDALEGAVLAAHDAITVKPELPTGCRGRMAEKWRPLARIAHAAGGVWVQKVNDGIIRDMEEVEREREDGMTSERPAVVLLRHIFEVWPDGEKQVTAANLVDNLVATYPDTWGELSNFGKALTAQRMGRWLSQAYKIHSTKVSSSKRAYLRVSFERAFEQSGLYTAQTAITANSDTTATRSNGGYGEHGAYGGYDSKENGTATCARHGCHKPTYKRQSYCEIHFIIDSEKGANAA